MATLHDLLLNVKLNPLDDEARLVLSDFLEDQGDLDRAEFVRAQMRSCARWKWYVNKTMNDVQELRLFKNNVFSWCHGDQTDGVSFGLRSGSSTIMNSVMGKFKRGFFSLAGSPTSLETGLELLPNHAVPWLERLRLLGWDDAAEVQSLLRRPELRAISALDFSRTGEIPISCLDLLDRNSLKEIIFNGYSTAFFSHLANATGLRLHKFRVGLNNPKSKEWDFLVQSPVLDNLRNLTLEPHDHEMMPYLESLVKRSHPIPLKQLKIDGYGTPGSNLHQFLASSAASEIEKLNIRSDSRAAKAIADSASLRALRHLCLHPNDLSTEDGEAMARSPAFERLESLKLLGKISPEGLHAIVTSPSIGPLEYLRLDDVILDLPLIALTQSPRMRHLRQLNLEHCTISDRGLQAIAESPYLQQLEFLAISGEQLEPDSLNALARSTQLSNLKGLRLVRMECAPSAFQLFVNSQLAKQLQMLDLSNTVLSEDHMNALADAERLDALRSLHLSEPSGPIRRLDPLMDVPWLDQLLILSLSNTGLDTRGLKKLTKSCRSGTLGVLELENNFLDDASAKLLLDWDGLKALGDIALGRNQISEELSRKVKEKMYQAIH